MASYNTSEFKSGMKILLDGEPFSIVENEMVKPGKGQAFNRVKVRNLKSGRTIERTFKSGDSVDAADVVDMDMQYLYQDGDFWIFMVPENFEQYTAGRAAVGDNAIWLKDGTVCIVTLVEQRAAAGHPAVAYRTEDCRDRPGPARRYRHGWSEAREARNRRRRACAAVHQRG